MNKLLKIRKQNGQAMTEFIVIAFVLLLLTLGLVQLIFVYQAKTNLNYATFEATRAGTLANASPKSIKHGFARGMAPSHMRVVDDPSVSVTSQDIRNTALTTAYQTAYDEIDDYVKIQRINPIPAHFATGSGGWGRTIPDWEITQENLDSGVSLYIPNEHLLYKATDKRAGITIHDANLLKLRITYCMDLIVPFANIIFENAYKLTITNSDSVFVQDETVERTIGNTFKQDCVDGDDRRIPIVAQSIMRMQSPARNYTF